jgi:hypothetical protein
MCERAVEDLRMSLEESLILQEQYSCPYDWRLDSVHFNAAGHPDHVCGQFRPPNASPGDVRIIKLVNLLREQQFPSHCRSSSSSSIKLYKYEPSVFVGSEDEERHMIISANGSFTLIGYTDFKEVTRTLTRTFLAVNSCWA